MNAISGYSGSSAYAQEIGTKRERRRPPDAEEMLNKLDADGSGGLSLAEFQAGAPKRADGTSGDDGRAAKLFAAIDVDADGNLTVDEMKTHAANRRGGPGGPPPGGAPPAGDGGITAEEASGIIDALDTDGDGKVSVEELLAALGKKTTDGANASEETAAVSGESKLQRAAIEFMSAIMSELSLAAQSSGAEATGATETSAAGDAANDGATLSFQIKIALKAYGASAA